MISFMLLKWKSIEEAQNILKIQHIWEVCNGIRKTAGGYKWRYVDDRNS